MKRVTQQSHKEFDLLQNAAKLYAKKKFNDRKIENKFKTFEDVPKYVVIELGQLDYAIGVNTLV